MGLTERLEFGFDVFSFVLESLDFLATVHLPRFACSFRVIYKLTEAIQQAYTQQVPHATIVIGVRVTVMQRSSCASETVARWTGNHV